ncbi:hypothetical protein [Dyella silvae]|uniref:hypothetical protein n=1 Tax=Dyella silvae TaxID=2994424 RepID=UPI0022651A34|nr:hypothetical protein [Dyella silvae]
MTIKVKLVPNDVPPVTVHPNPFSVNNGNETITWVPDADQSFTFEGLTGLPNPPFSNLDIQSTEITVQDANGNGASGTYTYAVSVTYNNQIYTSGPNIIAGGGQPSIKNN